MNEICPKCNGCGYIKSLKYRNDLSLDEKKCDLCDNTGLVSEEIRHNYIRSLLKWLKNYY